MKKLFAPLLFLLALPLLADSPKNNWAAQFADESGDEAVKAVLRVHYRSTGCFHSLDYQIDLDFTQKNHGLVKAVVTRLHNHSKMPSTFPPVMIGTLMLWNQDVQRFDHTLEYYQSLVPKSERSSTTVDNLAFQQIEDFKTTTLAEIEDSSMTIEDRLDSLSFGEIVDRAERTFANSPDNHDPVPASDPK